MSPSDEIESLKEMIQRLERKVRLLENQLDRAFDKLGIRKWE
jgi:polyhydroxyalkanoate synthesis regulator phasin